MATQPSLSFRVALSFNNPNQLGFYTLVNLAIFIYISQLAKEQKVVINKLLSMIIININLLFLFLASSRACIPVLTLYVISYFLIFRINVRGYGFWLFSIIGGSIGFSALYSLSHNLYLHMRITRSSRLPDDYDGLSFDIYSRAISGIEISFTNLWDFLIGSGSLSTATRGTMEFHNNFFAIFNEVGLFGLIIYIYMNIVIIKELYKKGLVYIMPYFCYLFYSLFQYSYRARTNWFLLAIVMFILIHNKIADRSKGQNVL